MHAQMQLSQFWCLCFDDAEKVLDAEVHALLNCRSFSLNFSSNKHDLNSIKIGTNTKHEHTFRKILHVCTAILLFHCIIICLNLPTQKPFADVFIIVFKRYTTLLCASSRIQNPILIIHLSIFLQFFFFCCRRCCCDAHSMIQCRSTIF